MFVIFMDRHYPPCAAIIRVREVSVLLREETHESGGVMSPFENASPSGGQPAVAPGESLPSNYSRCNKEMERRDARAAG